MNNMSTSFLQKALNEFYGKLFLECGMKFLLSLLICALSVCSNAEELKNDNVAKTQKFILIDKVAEHRISFQAKNAQSSFFKAWKPYIEKGESFYYLLSAFMIEKNIQSFDLIICSTTPHYSNYYFYIFSENKMYFLKKETSPSFIQGGVQSYDFLSSRKYNLSKSFAVELKQFVSQYTKEKFNYDNDSQDLWSSTHTLYEIIANDNKALKINYIVGPFRSKEEYDIASEKDKDKWISSKFNDSLSLLMKEVKNTISNTKAETDS